MGTKTHRKLAERRMKNSNSNLRLGSAARPILVLLAACLLAGGIFAQKRVINRPETVWPKDDASIVRMIASGTIEEKRDALFEIRNRETPEASRLAIPALSDKNMLIRATAAASVIFVPSDEAASVLQPLLKDKSSFVRREAAFALGRAGSRSASTPLQERMRKDKDSEVRTAAIVALGQVGDPAALPALLDFLRAKPKAEKEFQRRAAARSIGQIAQIVRGGKRMAVTPQSFLPERFKEVYSRDQAMPSSLAALFQPAVAILSGVLLNPRESDDTRREAAFSLGAIGDSTASGVLEKSIASPDYYLAEIAREALLKIEKQ